jgi:hypothetical protein
LLRLDIGLKLGEGCGLVIGSRSRGLASLHALHELLEVLLGVSTCLMAGLFHHPLGLPLGTMITVPPTILSTPARVAVVVAVAPVVSVVAIATVVTVVVVKRIGVLVVAIPPALGAVYALPIRELRLLDGLVLEPWFRLAPKQAVAGPSLCLFGIGATTLGLLTLVVAVTRLAVEGDAVATHATLEALGALSTEALARLYGAPALVILVGVVAASAAKVESASRVSESVIALSVAVAAEVEAVAVFAILVCVEGSATGVPQST